VGTGATVSVVSYAVGRSEAPSREEACGVLGSEQGVLVLTCDVDFGASGAPIFAMDGSIARIVSWSPPRGSWAAAAWRWAPRSTLPLAELRQAFAAPTGRRASGRGPRRPGRRSDALTGALRSASGGT
jgi:hypothetical protein